MASLITLVARLVEFGLGHAEQVAGAEARERQIQMEINETVDFTDEADGADNLGPIVGAHRFRGLFSPDVSGALKVGTRLSIVRNTSVTARVINSRMSDSVISTVEGIGGCAG